MSEISIDEIKGLINKLSLKHLKDLHYYLQAPVRYTMKNIWDMVCYYPFVNVRSVLICTEKIIPMYFDKYGYAQFTDISKEETFAELAMAILGASHSMLNQYMEDFEFDDMFDDLMYFKFIDKKKYNTLSLQIATLNINKCYKYIEREEWPADRLIDYAEKLYMQQIGEPMPKECREKMLEKFNEKIPELVNEEKEIEDQYPKIKEYNFKKYLKKTPEKHYVDYT